MPAATRGAVLPRDVVRAEDRSDVVDLGLKPVNRVVESEECHDGGGVHGCPPRLGFPSLHGGTLLQQPLMLTRGALC